MRKQVASPPPGAFKFRRVDQLPPVKDGHTSQLAGTFDAENSHRVPRILREPDSMENRIRQVCGGSAPGNLSPHSIARIAGD